MMRLYHPKSCQSESIQGFLLKEQEKAFWRHKISCFYEKFREFLDLHSFHKGTPL